jgi:hypothetical protein
MSRISIRQSEQIRGVTDPYTLAQHAGMQQATPQQIQAMYGAQLQAVRACEYCDCMDWGLKRCRNCGAPNPHA